MVGWAMQWEGGMGLSKESASSLLVPQTHLDGGRRVQMKGFEGSVWPHQLRQKMTRWRVATSGLCEDRAEVKSNQALELPWWDGWSSGQVFSR